MLLGTRCALSDVWLQGIMQCLAYPLYDITSYYIIAVTVPNEHVVKQQAKQHGAVACLSRFEWWTAWQRRRCREIHRVVCNYHRQENERLYEEANEDGLLWDGDIQWYGQGWYRQGHNDPWEGEPVVRRLGDY